MPNSRAEETANRKQKIKDLKEINNLHGQLNNQIEKEFKLTERFTTLSTKQLKIYNQIIPSLFYNMFRLYLLGPEYNMLHICAYEKHLRVLN